MPPRTDIPHQRLSASALPPEVEPQERDFMRLLERALAPSYTLVKRLGAGGMGAVYLARDPVLKRLVAVKVMAPALAADPAARARFEREAEAVASISHPNVVSVYNVGELENGVPFLVMQYIDGLTLAERLEKDGPFEARTAKRVIGEVASALAAAHRKGIIHRDIKPANILWDDDTGRALVTDFGIAAVLERGDERDAIHITHTGMAIGTPAYMSPEQLLAEPVTEKTDIYSLGLLGYELFIGEGPYQISSPREMMAAHLRDTPRKLSTMRGDVDPELERLLESCLAKDPATRPTAAEVEKRLAHGVSVLIEWPPPGLENLRPRLRGVLRVLLLGALALGVPVAVLSVFERDSFVRGMLPPNTVVFVVAAIGLLTFAGGMEGLRRFLRDARKAVARGYGWGTIVEVAADERGDTGVLIAGGREYAELAPQTRSTMRRSRVLALAMRALACIAPVLGFVLGVMVAARWDSGPTVVLWSSILISLTLLAAARAIHMQEERTMRPARARLRSAAKRTEGTGQLASAWAAAFEQVRAGQPMGMGPTGNNRLVRVSVVAVLVVTALAGVGTFLPLGLTAVIESAGSIAAPKFSNTTAKIARIRRLAAYRVAPDSSITGLRAGNALHAITRNGPGGIVRPFEKPPAIAIPPQRRASPPESDPFLSPEGRWEVLAFRHARRGHTVPQRDFLRSMADNTAMEEFRLLGRAPSLDLVAAYWDIRPGAEPTWMDLPIPKLTPVTLAAQANVAQAALDFAAGRTQEADRRLRENINVGFLMMDDGRTIVENLVGANIVNRTRVSLAAFYEATGQRLDAKLISAESDPVITIPDDAGVRRRMTLDEIRREVRYVILDDATIPGIRWEMLVGWFTWEPCSDMHQVIFGADSVHRATLDEARKRMVKRPSDSLFFAIVDRRTDRSAASAGHPVARTLSALTGNRQLEACLSLIGGLR